MPAPTAAVIPRALERPITVTVLAMLWLLGGACYGALGLGLAIFGPSGPTGIAAGAIGVFMAAFGGVIGFGLGSRATWARLLQLVAAAIGVFSCVFTLPSLAIIAYLLRPEVRLHFADPQHLSLEDVENARTATPESAFTAGIVATMLLGVLMAAVLGYFGLQYVRQAPIPSGKGDSMAIPTPAPTP
jgi:cbb3-type cytochrome oxidase subunit 3